MRGRFIISFAMIAFVAAMAAAQVGPDFQVNTYTTGHQLSEGIAVDGSGNFVVAWDSYQDASARGIFGQRFDGSGAFLGSEFQVNTWETSDQRVPVVDFDDSGNFVVAWWGHDQDGSNTGIFGQRFDASGSPVGSEFQVNSWTTSTQWYPAIASEGNGDFVIVWEGDSQDGSGTGIFGQRFDASGGPLGSEFRINGWTTGSQRLPSISMNGTGDFVVVWQSDGQDGSAWGIFGQRFDDLGVAAGSEFRINTWTSADQRSPAVACDEEGDFVVVWQSLQDSFGWAVIGQRFDAGGTPVGSEFLVNTFTVNHQGEPAVASDPGGNFVVVWQSYTQDSSGDGVFAQRFDASGARVGSEFRANTFTSSWQSFPVVGSDNDGNFVVAWQSDGQDGSAGGIFAALSTVTIGETGTIVVEKQTDPDGSAQPFSFDASSIDPNDPNETLADDGTFTLTLVPQGPYPLSETLIPGWTLTGIDCTVDSGTNDSALDPNDPATINVVLNAGQTVTCTFNNRQLVIGLSIAKTANTERIEQGGTIVYTITAANAGPDDAIGVTVADDFMDAFATVDWTCVGLGGGVCAANGTGDILDVVDLPAGGSVTYTATATLDFDYLGALDNTATVTAPAGFGGTTTASGTASANATTPIPATNQVTLIIFGVLLSIVAVIALRRR